ncbi:MAG: tRNA lysidine(34) synthetase TilS [Candidatus Neomarinimicrobiota bacterium]
MASLVPQFSKINQKYNLIDENQLILIAVSGGIDSMVLSRTLAEYRLAGYASINLIAVHLSISQVALSKEQLDKIKDLLASWHIPLEIISGKVLVKDKFDCYACARERRRQLFRYAADNHCDAVALGHNLDDYLETALMNLIYHGRLESLQPVQFMFNNKVRVIRPLLDISKKHILASARANSIQAVASPCIFQNDNQRQNIRETMRVLTHQNRNFRANLRRAINHWNNLDI